MLNELYISNFALIDEITITFDEGLNIFTGTTGVGKSLIIGALNFLLGSRATGNITRTDKNDVSVSGVFFIRNEQLRTNIKKHFDNFDDEEIIIHRTVDQNGRNRCRINNQPVTVSLLKEIGEQLVNIHGQHEHESLTNPLQQLLILDSFGKLDSLRSEYASNYRKAIEKGKLLQALQNKQSERKKEIDLYHYEINEIESAQLNPGEEEALQEQQYILANSEKIQTVLSFCSNRLYEADNSIIAGLKEIAHELSRICIIDKEFEKKVEICNQAVYQLEDIVDSMRSDVDKYEYDPGRLEQIEERIETVRRLKNKYGDSIEDILSYCENSKAKRDRLLKENEDIHLIEKELQQLKQVVVVKGQQLTQYRKKAGKKLSTLVKGELTELGIANGRFEINIAAIGSNASEQISLKDAGSSGFDRVEFMFSSNPGEELKPFRKIASGGECSRIMLALKRHLAQADQIPVLVFDEIDANIGGRMGRIIGEKLSLVSQSHQVICITHLPQIASYARQHFKVNKTSGNKKTSVTIATLSTKERLEEIAEMIRGDEKTDVTRKQAKEMMDDANRFITPS